MQEQTLELIRSYLEENKWIFLSSNEIASKVNLSRITVRRYMNSGGEQGDYQPDRLLYRRGDCSSVKYQKN